MQTARLDHINNDNTDNSLANLQLLCHAANILKNPRGLGRFSSRRKQGIDDIGVQKQISATLERNKYAEPRFRLWLLQQLKQHKFVEADDAVYSGAEVSGASIETVKRYLKKCLSNQGMFELDDGANVITLKKEFESQIFGEK